jgi:hypothetical protein
MTELTPKRLDEIRRHYPNALKKNTTPDWATFKQLLPPEMLKEKRFVRYFLKTKPEGGTAKIPLGNHSDPATWSTFDECVAALEPGKEQGIGYCFLGGEIHGLDIDHCRNSKTGQICNEAMVLLSRIPSWAEYSVSGQGIHVFFKGNVRGKELTAQCLQYWNPKNSPRFFALTCEMVGDAFKQLKDVGDEFNYIFATARHISAKIKEELKEVDYEQWAKLPAEPERVDEKREKSKQKTRKLHPYFNLEDFLKFYGLEVDNVTTNAIGKCYRLTTCPIKGEKHVGQNSTTTNFILSNDGGLGFHCQSTGCVEWSVAEVIKKLAEEKGAYPNPIYEAKSLLARTRSMKGIVASTIPKKHKVWLWPGYLEANKLVHFGGASAEGKSPVARDLVARITSGSKWPDGSSNTVGSRNVIVMAGEDDWEDCVVPGLELAGADMGRVIKAISTYAREEGEPIDVSTKLDEDMELLEGLIREYDAAAVVIDPITNYLGKKGMNKEDEMRSILMPLSTISQNHNTLIITIGHLNKRDKEASVLQRLMGAAAFGGVARQVFIFGNDPEDDDKFAHVMGLARNTIAPALKYKTVAVPYEWEGKTSDIIQIRWGGPAEHVNVDEVVNAPKQSDKTKIKEAAAFIKAFVRDGAKSTKAIEDALKDAGVDCSDLPRAARKAGAKSRKQKGSKTSGWEWYLPTPEQAEFDKEPPKKEAASVKQNDGYEQGAA